MTAKEILSVTGRPSQGGLTCCVDANMPLIDVLPRLLESPGHELGVSDGEMTLGVIDTDSMLEGLGRMITPRDDCSVITVDCLPEAYSASRLAMAVEDSDAQLVDLLTTPGSDGHLKVTLRIRHTDPAAAVRSLERYDYRVVDARGGNTTDPITQVAAERLLSLQTLMNV